MAKKFIATILVSFLIISLSIISGCVDGRSILNSMTKASLNINIAPALSTQTVVPIGTYIYSYTITGTGPNGATFEQTLTNVGGYSRSTTIPSLSLGLWTVDVDAKNSNGVLLGHGSSTVELQLGGASVEVNVTSLDGMGACHINLSWPSGIISNPNITGTITDNNNFSTPINFTLGSNNVSASYSNTSMDDGYYKMVIKINDGETLLRTIVEIVRIMADQTTTWTVELNTSDISSTSSDLTINITPDMKEPFDVYFKNMARVLPVGGSMDVAADVSTQYNSSSLNDQMDSFEWYLNGDILTGQTSDHITLGNDLTSGKYTLTLIVKKGDVYSSNTSYFNVSNNIATLFSDDGEDFSGITANGGWAKTTADFYSATHSWTTSPDGGPYSPTADMTITLPPLDLAGKNAIISFWHKYDTGNSYWNDNCIVEISTNEGTSWGYYDSGCFSGTSTEWKQVFINLYYCSNNTILRFHFKGNGNNTGNHTGWNVDDIKVYY